MTGKTGVTLRGEQVVFLSQEDEAAFFHWLEKLNDFATALGAGDTILIEVKSSKLDDTQLRELIALFHRYRIDMSQLVAFETRSNKTWLRNKQAFWYDAMYEPAHV